MDSQKIAQIKAKFLEKTYSADIYDVMDKMGYGNQCLSLKIKPLSDQMKVVGPAFTMLGTTEPEENYKIPGVDEGKFALFDHFYEHCVVVINAEKDDCCGHWGEMMSYGARNCGVSGVVIDGGTRDKMGILNISNWACFAKYTTPIESDKRWRPKQIQKPIYMSGSLTKYVIVNPGDWIFGDADGVIVIPEQIVEQVLEKVLDVSERERLSRDAFNNGECIDEVYRKFDRA